ncbi:MAG: T9SS type A sorting domain-containing protein, partial [Bacteroidales bacterium]|nr:T9SS type A sorting domain-containing protein [Bacteroidales bacterium]
FSGTFNNSDITFFNITKTTGKGEGWHLLGNPFQSALQWTNTDWAKSNIAAGAKIRNSGGTYTDITVGGTDIIPANQGFFIQVSVDGDNSITIPQSQCVHSSTAFYKSTVPNMLTLKAVDGDFYQESCIQFMDGSTENYDEDFDVRFLSGVSGAPKLYSIVGEENLSTNRIPQVENENIISLGFKSENETTINIKASGIESFANYIKILLEDKQENEIIDLRENSEYIFNSNPENNIERFKLHFKSATGIDENNKDIFDIYSNNNRVYIINPKFVDANVVVYNIMGQEIENMKLNGEEFNSFRLDVKQGYYIVKVISDESISTEKVFIK